MDEKQDNIEGLYPIRTVAHLTSVNPVTLRAWERRHGLISPHRTPKGHRLYSEQDISTIKQIVKLLAQGIPISQVSHIITKQAIAKANPISSSSHHTHWQEYQEKMLAFVRSYDCIQLDMIYNDALSLYSVDLVIHHLIKPVLNILYQAQKDSIYAIADYQFFHNYLKHKLGARFQYQNLKNNQYNLTAACITGEHNDIELLLLCLATIEKGIRIIFLGANMPLKPLTYAIQQSQSKGVILYIAAEPEANMLYQQLPAFLQETQVPNFVFGQFSYHHENLLKEFGFTILPQDYTLVLGKIKQSIE